MRVEQKRDGTYQRVLTPVEIMLIRNLTAEGKAREQKDSELIALILKLTKDVATLTARVKALEVKQQ